MQRRNAGAISRTRVLWVGRLLLALVSLQALHMFHLRHSGTSQDLPRGTDPVSKERGGDGEGSYDRSRLQETHAAHGDGRLTDPGTEGGGVHVTGGGGGGREVRVVGGRERLRGGALQAGDGNAEGGDTEALREGIQMRSPMRRTAQADRDGESMEGAQRDMDRIKVSGDSRSFGLPGIDNSGIWSVPLTEPPAGTTCEAWLEDTDSVQYSRDFYREPIVIIAGERKRWECNVSCHFEYEAKAGRLLDGHLGGMGSGQNGILRSMEPRSYYSINDVNAAKRGGYKVVMTVHLDSDVPVGYFSWEEYDIMKPITIKKAWPALAVAFISNCNANNFRIEAVEKLQHTVAVDSYGRCATNRPHQSDKMETISNYKFCLAFENSCEDDYVTEKFWQSLVAGCVPIVVGAPNIKDFAPAEGSYVHIKSANEIEGAAQKIQEISNTPGAWEQMVEWKTKGPSTQFKALLDMSAVHSSCRLCIYLADEKHVKDEQMVKQRRPCRCKERTPEGQSQVVYHIYVRERGRFYFSSLYLRESTQLTLEALKEAIRATFRATGHEPIWRSKRPPVLVGESDLELNIYKIYPAGSTQRAALYGNAAFNSDDDLRTYLGSHPCAKLEVIFV